MLLPLTVLLQVAAATPAPTPRPAVVPPQRTAPPASLSTAPRDLNVPQIPVTQSQSLGSAAGRIKLNKSVSFDDLKSRPQPTPEPASYGFDSSGKDPSAQAPAATSGSFRDRLIAARAAHKKAKEELETAERLNPQKRIVVTGGRAGWNANRGPNDPGPPEEVAANAQLEQTRNAALTPYRHKEALAREAYESLQKECFLDWRRMQARECE